MISDLGEVHQDIPLKFKVNPPYLTLTNPNPYPPFTHTQITRDGTGECEASAVLEALDTKFEDLKVWLKSPEDRLLRCVSSTTDNASAAQSVSTLLREKKLRIFDDLVQLYGPDHSHLQGVVRELHGLTCSNHTHNLAGEAWWGSWRHSVVYLNESKDFKVLLCPVYVYLHPHCTDSTFYNTSRHRFSKLKLKNVMQEEMEVTKTLTALITQICGCQPSRAAEL